MKEKYFIFILLLSSMAYTQEVQEPRNRLTADGMEVLKHVWKSSWIAHPTASQTDYGVFLFQREFRLSKVPEHFTIYVSADNRYKLYVNGEYAGTGPARGDHFCFVYV